jgi:hypothetical protein
VSGRSLVQRSNTECGVSQCDREDLIMGRPWPINGCCAVAGVCVCVCVCRCEILYKCLKLLHFGQVGQMARSY